MYIYKLIGEGWANAAFSLYWGMCPGVHMAGQKLDTPLHGWKHDGQLLACGISEKQNISTYLQPSCTQQRGKDPWPPMSTHDTCPDSKIASTTCPAMECGNLESWGGIHRHIKARNLKLKSLNWIPCMYIPIINAGRLGFNLIPPVLRPMLIFFCRNPAWPKQVFGLWNFETDRLSEDGKHCFYMIYLWWEMNYGGSSPSEFLSISWAFECLFEKKNWWV